MSSNKGKDINITFTHEEMQNNINNDSLTESYEDYKKYIINNNTQLLSDNRNYLLQIKKLEQELLDKENEEDKNDNRIRYMKGLMHNLIELNKFYISLAEKYKKLSDINENLKIEMSNIHYNFFLYSTLLNIFIYLFNLGVFYISNTYLILFYNICIFIICIYIIHYMSIEYKKSINILDDKNNICLNNIIKEIMNKKEEIKNLKEATTSLDNWICEI